MKSIVLLAVTIGGCSALQAAHVDKPTAAHAHAFAVVHRTDVAPLPAPLPSSKCDGSGWITHGDGHRTACPGCDNCKKKSIIKPAVLTLVRSQCADGSCAIPTAPAADCECTKATGSCACAATTTSGSCASGSCGTSSVKAGGPVRRVIKAKPVRRFLGRLFRRR